MNSIDKNQPEDNVENLSGSAAVEKIRELAEGKSCFFCTGSKTGATLGNRPMSVLQVDDEGNLWFLSANDSHKNKEIGVDPMIKLYFQGSAHSDLLFLKGMASITYNHDKIKELWGPLLKTWFTEGVNDPRISVIKVEPTDGYYWDNKHGNAVSGIKILLGAIVGKTLDDSLTGSLKI